LRTSKRHSALLIESSTVEWTGTKFWSSWTESCPVFYILLLSLIILFCLRCQRNRGNSEAACTWSFTPGHWLSTRTKWLTGIKLIRELFNDIHELSLPVIGWLHGLGDLLATN